MNETDKNMVTVPLDIFIDGINAMADLNSVRAMLLEGREYCSDAIKAVLGIPVKEEENQDA